MTQAEWALKRENLTLRLELMRAQAQLLQVAHDQAQAELAALGTEWVAPADGQDAPAQNQAS